LVRREEGGYRKPRIVGRGLWKGVKRLYIWRHRHDGNCRFNRQSGERKNEHNLLGRFDMRAHVDVLDMIIFHPG